MSKRYQVKFRVKSDPNSTSRNSVNSTMVTASTMCDARNQVKARYANSLHGVEIISVVEK
ncbi:hypothetical protein [Veillonella caviae]|uniref:hypothetical protein n=1 Tax=Veillonella caviae TaxID=248316 RepID=UPI000F8E9554|nr:hypothetical protein [Veillonella caviae]MCF0158389.1 hypothetical protein [Veillonella sp.]MDD7290771.1 hypothetical protein [Veillonella caviae]MDY5254348.1 hypothetical protein [Veillonella caviae]MDY5787641.1 hypothetical protein [Veillonella caviae]MDY6225232.1 hypothetical protein [Veillonella caviae]